MSTSQKLPMAIVAESDEETRFLIRSLLEFLAFDVIEVPNGQQAFENAVIYQPDIILIELKSPVVIGYTAIRRIKKTPDLLKVPIIAISSTSARTSEHLAITAGCSAYVEKPIEFDLLESIVESLVCCDRLSAVSLLVH